MALTSVFPPLRCAPQAANALKVRLHPRSRAELKQETALPLSSRAHVYMSCLPISIAPQERQGHHLPTRTPPHMNTHGLHPRRRSSQPHVLAPAALLAYPPSFHARYHRPRHRAVPHLRPTRHPATVQSWYSSKRKSSTFSRTHVAIRLQQSLQSCSNKAACRSLLAGPTSAAGHTVPSRTVQRLSTALPMLPNLAEYVRRAWLHRTALRCTMQACRTGLDGQRNPVF